jgi:OOP family OmpA-OmpF porin
MVVALTLIAAPTLVPAAGFYVGASGGQAWVDVGAGEIENAFALDDAFRASDTRIDDTDTGWKAYAGYRFNPYIAIEGGYVDLGEASFQTTITDAPPPYDAFTPFRIEGLAEATGYNLVAIVGVPLGAAGFVFAKAGAFRWDADFTERVPSLGATRLTRSESDTKPTYGVGLEVKLWEAVHLRAELERFEEVGAGIGGREGTDIDMASAGLIFQF